MDIEHAFLDPLLYDLKTSLPNAKASAIPSGLEIISTLSKLADSGILPNIVASYEAKSDPRNTPCKLVIIADLDGECVSCVVAVYIGSAAYRRFSLKRDISLCSNTASDKNAEAGLPVMAGQIMDELKDGRCFMA